MTSPTIGIGYLFGLSGVIISGSVLPVVPTGAAVSVAAALAEQDHLLLIVLVIAFGAAGAYIEDLITYAALALRRATRYDRLGSPEPLAAQEASGSSPRSGPEPARDPRAAHPAAVPADTGRPDTGPARGRPGRLPLAALRRGRHRGGHPVVDDVRVDRPGRAGRVPEAVGRRRGGHRTRASHQFHEHHVVPPIATPSRQAAPGPERRPQTYHHFR